MECVAHLLEYRADVSLRDDTDKTALDYATSREGRGMAEITRLLKDAGPASGTRDGGAREYHSVPPGDSPSSPSGSVEM